MFYESDFDCVFHCEIKNIINESNSVWLHISGANIRHTYGGQLQDKVSVFINNNWLEVKKIKFSSYGIALGFDEGCVKNVHKSDYILYSIDMTARKQLSVMHTGIHLLCSLVDAEMKNAHAGFKKSRIDFIGEFKSFVSQSDAVVEAFHKKIAAAHDVKVLYATKEEVIQLGDVKEFDRDDLNLYRIVEIQGVDRRICMGTHVENTSFLKDLKISKIKEVGDHGFKINISIH